MLTSWGRARVFCDAISRRDMLCAGSLGLAGLTLADLLRQEAAAESAGRPARPKSVIYIVLAGGPSHIDMYDLKPQAPAEYRGPFRPISTALPGVRICEHMPRQAAMLDRLALLRGVRSVENDHYLSEVYTGLPRSAGQRPAFGSIVSRLAADETLLPTYVSLDEATTDPFEYEKPHYAGAGHGPFRPFGEFLNDMDPVAELDRLTDRKQLLASFDRLQRRLDRPDAWGGLDRFQSQALAIMASPQIRDAFDLSRVPAETLARYGRGQYAHQAAKDILYDWDARPFLRALRLVEAGARVVTLRVGAWDHHSGPASDIFDGLRRLLPLVDQSFCALTDDLRDRGLQDDVLVVMLGEFGRTPKISPLGPGREHWAEAGCAVLAGGGLRMGQVIGETDSRAERAKSRETTFQNIVATIYHVLGIDTEIKLPDFNGRPQHLLDDRQPIAELLG